MLTVENFLLIDWLVPVCNLMGAHGCLWVQCVRSGMNYDTVILQDFKSWENSILLIHRLHTTHSLSTAPQSSRLSDLDLQRYNNPIEVECI